MKGARTLSKSYSPLGERCKIPGTEQDTKHGIPSIFWGSYSSTYSIPGVIHMGAIPQIAVGHDRQGKVILRLPKTSGFALSHDSSCSAVLRQFSSGAPEPAADL